MRRDRHTNRWIGADATAAPFGSPAVLHPTLRRAMRSAQGSNQDEFFDLTGPTVEGNCSCRSEGQEASTEEEEEVRHRCACSTISQDGGCLPYRAATIFVVGVHRIGEGEHYRTIWMNSTKRRFCRACPSSLAYRPSVSIQAELSQGPR